MAFMGGAGIVVGKELRTEFRSRELLSTTVVFVLMVMVLFSFTFDPTTTESRRFGPGLLWISFLFAASLMLQPSFLREQANDTLTSLRMATGDAFAIFLGKVTANALFLLVMELLMLPVFGVMYNAPILPELKYLLVVLILGDIGIATTGTALAAISAQARMRELLLPLLL